MKNYLNYIIKYIPDKNLEKRYCKFDQIAGHIYFKDFNWNELISLNMEPAYIPKIPNIEYKYEPKPFVEHVKTLSDWEPPSGRRKTSFYRWVFPIILFS